MKIDEILKRINCDVSLSANFSGEEVKEIVDEIREDLKNYIQQQVKNNVDLHNFSKCIYCKNTPKKGHVYCDECMQVDDYTA